MRQSRDGEREAVLEATRAKPFLGLFIGMQMLFEHGEGRRHPGNGLRPAGCRRFPGGGKCGSEVRKGWNEVFRSSHALWNGIADRSASIRARYYPQPADRA